MLMLIWYIYIAGLVAIPALAVLLLALYVKRRKDLKVRIVKIRKEDVELTRRVSRFLGRYKSKRFKLQKPAGEPEKTTKAKPRHVPKKEPKHAHKKHAEIKAEELKKEADNFSHNLSALRDKSTETFAFEKELSSIRHTLNFGSSLSKKTLIKTKNKINKLRNDIAKEKAVVDAGIIAKSLKKEADTLSENLIKLKKRGIDTSKSEAELSSIRHTLNFGSSLSQKTLIKTKNKINKIAKKIGGF